MVTKRSVNKTAQPTASKSEETQSFPAKRVKKVQQKKQKPAGRRLSTTALQKKIEKLQSEREVLQERLLRLAAEFDNYRKITAREVQARTRLANESLISDLLPVLDDLERFVSAGEDGKTIPDIKAFYDGIVLIHQKFKKVLESRGLEPIEAAGKEFDVDLHEALMMVESKEHPADTVAQEIQRGYKLNDKVIRHTKVAVAR